MAMIKGLARHLKSPFFGLILALPLLSGVGLAADYSVGLGPFVGSGSISTGAKVRNATGYSLSIERPFELGVSGFTLGPRFEFANSLVNTRKDGNNRKELASYDTRIFATGFTLAHSIGSGRTLAQALYFTGLIGRAYSKLELETSTSQSYRQDLYDHIYGSYFATEVGTLIPLKGDFGLNIAFASSLYRVTQKDACGTYSGDEVGANGGLGLTSGSDGCGSGSLSETVDLRTAAVKVGLALGF